MPRPLLLVPTAVERDAIIAASSADGGLNDWRIELCGFGVVAAAAMTMRSLTRDRPDRVVLAGIAGSLNPGVPVGSAVWFSNVMCEGIGVGGEVSDRFIPAGEMGWSQISGATDGNGCDVEIGDRLSLELPAQQRALRPVSLLMTVCAASASPTMAQCRIDRADGTPLAEDMEGFAVAMACRLEGIPCSIVRGISNVAGDRNHDRWQIGQALQSVANEIYRARFGSREQ